MKKECLTYLKQYQSQVCDMIKGCDPAFNLIEDAWQSGKQDEQYTQSKLWQGEGLTCVGSGEVFEQAGVNFSHVKGDAMPKAATAGRPELVGASFEAMGVSIVLHSRNPFVPTAHMNIRYFEAQPESGEPVWWFGGGFDLTPFYPFDEDCIHFHQMAKAACDPFGAEWYPKFKKWADDYFYLKHRQESRGIGGLFFDDFNTLSIEDSFAFIQSVGEHFIKAYAPIVNKRKNTPFTQKERDFQCYRRGRYVEFNLVYDRGTLFGLQNGGRTESILMSLPPEVHFAYNYSPKPGSAESMIMDRVKAPKDWLGNIADIKEAQ